MLQFRWSSLRYAALMSLANTNSQLPGESYYFIYIDFEFCVHFCANLLYGLIGDGSLEHAMKRDAPLVAEYLGGAVNCDRCSSYY